MKEFHDRRVPSALTSLSRMGSQPPPPRSIEPAVFGLGMRTIWVCVIFLRIFGIFKFQGLFRDFSAFQTNVFDDSRLRLIPPFLFGCQVVGYIAVIRFRLDILFYAGHGWMKNVAHIITKRRVVGKTPWYTSKTKMIITMLTSLLK